LNLTTEIARRAGVELREETIGRIETVRDLLREVAEQPEKVSADQAVSPLEEPQEYISEDQQRWLRPQGSILAAVSSTRHGLNKLLMNTLFRARAVGLKRALPALENGPVILTPNHVSYLDPFAMASVLEHRWLRRIYWAGWTGIAFRGPLTRTFSRIARVLPVDPDRGVKTALAFGAAVLDRGQNLVWFPEGRRSPSGDLQPFQPGVGMLLAHFQVPALPIYIHGTYEALPRDRIWPRSRPITVVFGKPVEPKTLSQGLVDEQPHERIARELRRRVASLKDDLYPESAGEGPADGRK
jgi:long-chain acyl-CoA synthetase